jgi:hypothetical protein
LIPVSPGPQQQAVRRRRSTRPVAASAPAAAGRALALGLLLAALAGTGATAQEAAADPVLADPVLSDPALADEGDVAAEAAIPAVAPPRGEGPAGAAELPAVNHWSTGVNATGAVLMTPLFPGWGQLYADGGWRAALAFGAEMYFWSNLLSRDRQARRDLDHAATLPAGDAGRNFAEALAAEHREQMKDFVWWSGGALLIIALDAYVGAHLFNFDRDAVPVPDRWEDVFGPVGSGPAVSAGSGPQVTVFQWRKGF